MVYDIIIVGSGPAGLTSAIYAKRANKSVLVIEKDAVGGMITHSPKIENYPGYNVISGLDLADKFVAQAMDLKADFEFDEVKAIEKVDNIFKVTCSNANFEAKSIILAVGSTHRKLNLEHEDELVGHGVSYCAVCDGPFYTNQDVVIVGGGNSALQEALLLASYTKSVTMIQNLSFLTGEKALIEQVNNSNKIKVIYNSKVISLNGTNAIDSINVTNGDEITRIPCACVFVAIGQVAANEAFNNLASLDENGFIVSDDLCSTNVAGVYVAGDCKVKKIRQIVTATSDGSIAALQAIRYLDSNF